MRKCRYEQSEVEPPEGLHGGVHVHHLQDAQHAGGVQGVAHTWEGGEREEGVRRPHVWEE